MAADGLSPVCWEAGGKAGRWGVWHGAEWAAAPVFCVALGEGCGRWGGFHGGYRAVEIICWDGVENLVHAHTSCWARAGISWRGSRNPVGTLLGEELANLHDGIIPIRKMREVVVPWVRLRMVALGFHRDSVESVRDARGVRAHELCRKRLEMSVRRTGRGEGERHARRLALSWSGHCDEVVFCRGRREDGSSGQDEGCGGLHCDDSLLLVRVDESNVR